MITILGPTATGKTRLAALTAAELNGEIISADSRQVFRGMNLGTGKDYDDYNVAGQAIKAYLIDIEEPGNEFSVHRFTKEFQDAYSQIKDKNKLPILCGGTGLYLEAVLKGYNIPEVPENKELRLQLRSKTQAELNDILKNLKESHNTTDYTDIERSIRAIEIATYMEGRPKYQERAGFPSIVFGIFGDRSTIRARITERLRKRLDQGLIEEVEALYKRGVSYERLEYYGLEYRYISLYLQCKISYDEMFVKLNTAIHQFAKRQMTWFRRMEKNGIKINPVDMADSEEKKLNYIIEMYRKSPFAKATVSPS